MAARSRSGALSLPSGVTGQRCPRERRRLTGEAVEDSAGRRREWLTRLDVARGSAERAEPEREAGGDDGERGGDEVSHAGEPMERRESDCRPR